MMGRKKPRVLLIRPKYTSLVANLEPLGLEYLAGLAKELKINCRIHDEFQYPWAMRLYRLVRRIEHGKFDFIGFNANANTVDIIIKRARQLKQRFPNITIMVGGPEAELNYKEFCTDDIDIVYYDNGLMTLKKMWSEGYTSDKLRDLSGICYKENGKWIIKEKGAPVCGFITKPDRTAFYKGLKNNYIFMKGKFALSKASFSCPYNCTFCYCTKMNSGEYTERDLMEVVDEIEELKHDKIWFVDDTFFFDKERVRAFCNEVLRRGLKKQFMAYARADFLAANPDILPLAYKAGFRDIMVGLEAISDETLDEYNKQTSRNENIMAIKNLRDAGLVCNGLFVINYTATRDDFRKLLQFVKGNNLLWVVFGIFTPYKGTDAYDEYKDKLIHFKSWRLDGTHLTLKPTNMSSVEFMLRYYWLHAVTYPKIIVRAMLGTAYDTKKKGWF
ncbi:MAG: B12-binding domain-containing radical SAM protein [Lachnospiraceae bacterium]|nr:B12-binding domain-containing radical SAM protein [Lachnospiraceae bacterium]